LLLAHLDIRSSSGNSVSYSGGGSGTGRNNADRGINDFNFSDVPFSGASSTLLHIPAVAAPIAIGYNLTGGKCKGFYSTTNLSFSKDIYPILFLEKLQCGMIQQSRQRTIRQLLKQQLFTRKIKRERLFLIRKLRSQLFFRKQTETSDVVKLPAETIRVIYPRRLVLERLRI
jgi:hypothetical protein